MGISIKLKTQNKVKYMNTIFKRNTTEEPNRLSRLQLKVMLAGVVSLSLKSVFLERVPFGELSVHLDISFIWW